MMSKLIFKGLIPSRFLGKTIPELPRWTLVCLKVNVTHRKWGQRTQLCLAVDR